MGTQSAPTIHYEVYTFNGQRWNLHARYERTEREAAIGDAKSVERTLQLCAKVVKETYFSSNNVSEETVVYSGDKSLRAATTARANAVYRAPRGSSGSGGGSGDGSSALADGRKKTPAASPVASIETFTRLLVVVLAAMTLAAIAAGLARLFLESPGAHRVISSITAILLEYATFVVVFLGAAYPLVVKFMHWRPGPRRPMSSVGAKPAPTVKRGLSIISPPQSPEADSKSADQDAVENKDGPLPPSTPSPSVPLPQEEEVTYAAPVLVEEAPHPAEEAPAPAKETPPPAPVETFDSLRVQFIHFLKDLLSEIRKSQPNLDAYNVFGVQLFLAGGVDSLGNIHGLSQTERRELLKTAIDTLGGKPENSKVFAERYEEYLVEPKYMSMLQSGRSTMEIFLAGGEGTPEEIGKIFKQWNRPQKTTEQSSARIMTVVFTDMIGSTDLTQARGDQDAQHVVRRHNSIVRSALAQYSGKEIKHTGDGIMASFGSAANGVACCILIQQQISEHNDKRPDQPLHVRIGINAGEPIEEENDIFGSTVQLSARVCAKCEADEILVTNVVKELASGKGIEFESIGAQELKGFQEPVPLYQVRWR